LHNGSDANDVKQLNVQIDLFRRSNLPVNTNSYWLCKPLQSNHNPSTLDIEISHGVLDLDDVVYIQMFTSEMLMHTDKAFSMEADMKYEYASIS